jgi:tRNA(Ile2) C34 agmatinyltransferase TiaS
MAGLRVGVKTLKKDEITIEKMNDEDFRKYEGKEILFVPKKCPKCGALMSVRELGVWGYWCNECEFWWGTYEPYPIVRDAKKQPEKKARKRVKVKK